MSDAAGARRDVVLVVDDTPESLSFLTDTLESEGITVLVATSGENCLALLDEITPDLVLMDAVMPGLDGFETCRRLKREKLLSHVPVIFMTGLTETEHVVRGLQAGGVDYVPKPIVVGELLARIRVHLANARMAHASRTALDATGRYLVSTDASGRLLWSTPRAEQLLHELMPAAQGFTPEFAARLASLRGEQQTQVLALGGRRFEFSFVSSTGPDEYLYRLREVADPEAVQQAQTLQLQQALALTAREAEVLLWISRGKANRDISEILNISPRTVNKHLEQVFEKLGVENRASAAARAVRVISQ
ncbi:MULTISPECIES: response regulator transcription factor [Hydrocarboniphaga]|uniref:Two component transcriptional regulator, LuxR family n=1 Tax=Hydrocarboniphaga effusa AP103 TaxID=1172194 RepID=I8I432_9GAMM|nr:MULTISPECIES: response regulator transcription factor [Hydrocarboniphaga]EIT70911.1 two component transcriptional regulator, LuxR family [Hydrocarboniphaga effusa AP103]MDZ4077820.1 response regulator transcription factor [Hydrocarboniphaga sp.]